MLEVLLDWRGDDVVDEARLATDLGEFAFDYADMQLKDLKIGVLLRRVAAILREHSIVLPVDLTLLFKALISLEGLGRQYDPEFRLIERAKPFLDRAMRERYQPAEAARRAQDDAQRLLWPGHVNAARPCAVGQRRAARPHAGRSRPQAPRQLRPSPPQCDELGDHRHHDGIARGRLLHRDDGGGRADRCSACRCSPISGCSVT